MQLNEDLMNKQSDLEARFLSLGEKNAEIDKEADELEDQMIEFEALKLELELQVQKLALEKSQFETERMLFLKEKEELNKESEALMNTLIIQNNLGIGTGLPTDKSELKDMQLDLLNKAVEFDKRKLDILAREKLIEERTKTMDEKEKEINKLNKENMALKEKLNSGYENLKLLSKDQSKVQSELDNQNKILEEKEIDVATREND